jgi:hypothetical protein
MPPLFIIFLQSAGYFACFIFLTPTMNAAAPAMPP